MSRLTITDENGESLAAVDLAASGLGSHLRSAASLRALLPARRLFASPLTDRQGTRSLALQLDADIPVGDALQLSINGGASAGIGIHQSGATLFDDGDLPGSRVVPNGTTYASLALEAVLGASAAVRTGSVSLGFAAGTSMRYSYFHSFDAVGPSPTVAQAVETLLGAAVVPADMEDLARLPVGSIATLAGEGELSFSGQAELSATSNLLATPGLPLVGAIAVTRAGSVSARVDWRLQGGFEIRAEKVTTSEVRLSYFRRRGRSLSVSATATGGVSVPIRGRDALTMLMTAISPNPEADVVALVEAGLDDKTIEAIQAAITASIDRSLSVTAQLEISARSEQEALIGYEIDLQRADDAARQAVSAALHGRLNAIEQLASMPGAAVRVTVSAASNLERRTTAWRVNLLGILNVRSLVELVQKGHVTFDPLTGSLTAADEITGKRIRVASRPLESDAEKLRQVLFESLLITTAYQASRALGPSLSLTAEQMFLEQRRPTRRADLEEHYRALVGLGLCDEAERDRRLAAAADLGASTFFIRNRFDPAACDALFLDAAGKPRRADEYEAIGRRALVALFSPSDPDQGFRRALLQSDEAWAQARQLGDELRRALPERIRNDVRRLDLVRGDILTIAWWAGAMSRAAGELAEMRAFLGSRTGEALRADPEFDKRRRTLADRLGNVVATTAARFDMPWDVLAMDEAARTLGRLEAAIVSSQLSVRYTDGESGESMAAPRARGVTPAASAAARRSRNEREWTRDELDTFHRHVVNLRQGKLSDSGTFSSSADQVARIFREHIPEYAAAQRRAGRPARVVFFAHGGLTEEADGLRGVLKRRSFWRLNGVYPVYFVWETGLLETLRDILRLRPAGARERAGVTDGAIELAARRGGKAVWSRMKKSAEQSAGREGGARLTAELAADLFAGSNGDVEFHALGHSAGAIFLAHFVPLLVQSRTAGTAPTLQTLHLLAPAITSDLFKSTLMPLIGAGLPITSLATYTMTDDLEQLDDTVRPYGKSLLYLVSGSFEDEVPTRLLGLQKSLRQDAPLIRFFGIAGREKVADIVFSKSDPTAPRHARSESVTHGGFDNDAATMTSVIRRIVAASDSTAVTDYFEDEVDALEAVGEAPAAIDGAPEAEVPARTPKPSRARKAGPRSGRKS